MLGVAIFLAFLRVGEKNIFTSSNVVMYAGLVPTAMVIPGGVLPIDLALGVALPVHSHIALNFVSTNLRPLMCPVSTVDTPGGSLSPVPPFPNAFSDDSSTFYRSSRTMFPKPLHPQLGWACSELPV